MIWQHESLENQHTIQVTGVKEQGVGMLRASISLQEKLWQMQ
jgi:hypothetical protein